MTDTRLAETMRGIGELLNSGQYPAAHARLQAVVAANPEYAEALRLLAGTTQTLGDLQAAEELFRRALALDPAWPPTLTSLAELLLTSGRSAEAVPLLQQAVRSSPRAAYLLTRLRLEAGEATSALEVAALWVNSGKADINMAEQLVAAYGALGRRRDAVAHAQQLTTKAPGDPVAQYVLALALQAAQQPRDAESVVRGLMARTRPNAALLLAQARSLIDLEQFAEAEAALRDCVRLEPQRSEAHDRLAQLVWMRTGDIGAATVELDRALSKHAQDDALWAAKAALLQEAGDPRAALACLTERVSRTGSNPNLLIRAGLAALEFDSAAAHSFAERALHALPGNPTARKLLCAARLGVGDGRGALAECESLLQGSPDDQYLIAMQTTALRLLGDARYELLCDYDRMVLPVFLETPPGWSDLGSFLADLAERLSALHSPHGHRLLYQSLRQGTETTQDLSRSQDPVIQALFASFAAPIERYRQRVGQGSDPLRRRNQGPARFNGAWSVRLRTGGYHMSHVHPRGWISSACYIRLPDSMRALGSVDGGLSFGAPGLLTSPGLDAQYAIRPEEGMLVLFPSYFWHGTLPFHGEQPRLTVAFDSVPGR